MEKIPVVTSQPEEQPKAGLSRREFLAGMGAALGSLTVLPDEVLAKDSLQKVIGTVEAGEPKVSLEMLLSRHAIPEDLKESHFKEKLTKSDVFLIEAPAWSAKLERDLNAIAQGKLTPRQYWANQHIPEQEVKTIWSHQNARYEEIYKSKKFISSVDIPEGPFSNLVQDMISHMDTPELGKDHSEMMRLYKDKWRFWADLQIQREQYMVESFKSLVEAIKHRQIPQLKDKSDVNILFQVGYNHTSLYHALRAQNPGNVHRSAQMPYVFSLEDELLRRYLFNKEVPDDFLAEALLGGVFLDMHHNFNAIDGLKTNQLQRYVVSRFTPGEIKNLFDTIRASKLSDSAVANLILERCKEKGIFVPRTLEEFAAWQLPKGPDAK